MICPSCNLEGGPEKRVELGGRGERRGGVRQTLVCRSCEEPWRGELPSQDEPAAPSAEPTANASAFAAPAERMLQAAQALDAAASALPESFDPIAVIQQRLAWVEAELARFTDLKTEQKQLRKMLAAGNPARRSARSGAN